MLVKLLALAERHQLHREQVLDRLWADLFERAGELAAALEVLEGVVARERAHEAAHVGLVRLYARTGQRAEALRQYQQLAEVLRHELETKPSPASQQLYQAILDGQFP